MIDLYTWPTPNGRKISIALEEFDLDYTAHPINIGKDEQLTPEFLDISPNNKIPAMVDRATGRSMMESGAILIYLAETYDKFWGDDRYETLEWLMFQMGGLGPMLGQAHHFLHYNPDKAPYADARYRAEARRLYSVLNTRLQNKEYLSGSYSIADIATWPWISRYEWQEIDWQDYPALKTWYVKIAQRAAVQRGYKIPMEVNEIPIPE
jgi:GST-like protein